MVEEARARSTICPPDIVAARRKAAEETSAVSAYPHRRHRYSEFPMQMIPMGQTPAHAASA